MVFIFDDLCGSSTCVSSEVQRAAASLWVAIVVVALQSLMSACSFWSNKSRQKLEGRDAMAGSGVGILVLDGIGTFVGIVS